MRIDEITDEHPDGYDWDDLRVMYRAGMCDVFALALHRLTGLPLGMISVPVEDPNAMEDDEPRFENFHAVVIVDLQKQQWLDVAGIHQGIPQQRPITDFKVLGPCVLRPVDEETVAYAFSHGVGQGEIEEAIEYIFHHDPKLLADLAPLVRGYQR